MKTNHMSNGHIDTNETLLKKTTQVETLWNDNGRNLLIPQGYANENITHISNLLSGLALGKLVDQAVGNEKKQCTLTIQRLTELRQKVDITRCSCLKGRGSWDMKRRSKRKHFQCLS